jgi:hypothetical protein
MKKIIFMLTAVIAVMLTSCSNDDIPVSSATVITVNPSSVIKNFTYQLSTGDLDGVDSDEQLRIRLYVYNSNGVLSYSEEKDLRNYLTSAKFELALKPDENYTAVVLTDITTDTSGNVPEYWGVENEQSISTLQVTYLASDYIVYGHQEVLGIGAVSLQGGENVTVAPEAAGALICSYAANIHAYSNIAKILLFGSRGNNYYSFDESGYFNASPDIEAFETLMNLDVNNTSSYGIYTYKFTMPQTNFDLYVGFYDSESNLLSNSAKSGLTIQKGHEYYAYVLLDPNDNGDGKYSYSFSDVTGKVYGRSSVAPRKMNKANTPQNVQSAARTQTAYKVKDLTKLPLNVK